MFALVLQYFRWFFIFTNSRQPFFAFPEELENFTRKVLIQKKIALRDSFVLEKNWSLKTIQVILEKGARTSQQRKREKKIRERETVHDYGNIDEQQFTYRI
jgi:hypothetical protein